jgi:hypothetical protein
MDGSSITARTTHDTTLQTAPLVRARQLAEANGVDTVHPIDFPSQTIFLVSNISRLEPSQAPARRMAYIAFFISQLGRPYLAGAGVEEISSSGLASAR